MVNDLISEGHRRQLVQLAPYLAATSGNDPRASAAAALVCLQAGLPVAGSEARAALLAGLDSATALSASVPSSHRWRAARARAQARRLSAPVRAAIRAVADAQLSMQARDAALQRLLVDATNAVRRARQLSPVSLDELIAPTASIRVVREWTIEPGCDWLSLSCVPVSEAERERVFGRASVAPDSPRESLLE